MPPRKMMAPWGKQAKKLKNRGERQLGARWVERSYSPLKRMGMDFSASQDSDHRQFAREGKPIKDFPSALHLVEKKDLSPGLSPGL